MKLYHVHVDADQVEPRADGEQKFVCGLVEANDEADAKRIATDPRVAGSFTNVKVVSIEGADQSLKLAAALGLAPVLADPDRRAELEAELGDAPLLPIL